MTLISGLGKIKKSLSKEINEEYGGNKQFQLRLSPWAPNSCGSLTFLLPAFLRHLPPLFHRILVLETTEETAVHF